MKKLVTGSLLLLAFVACTKSSVNSQSGDFSQFAATQNISESADCSAYCVQLKKEFRYVVSMGEKMYCYWNEKQAKYGVDFKAQAVDFENQITSKMKQGDYFLLLYRWGSLFHDGHVGPILRQDLSEIEFYTPSIRLEMIAPATDHEALIVSQIGEDVSQLKIGYEVDTIQGIPWKELAQEAEAYAIGSTDRMRRRQVGNLIFRRLLDKEGPLPVKIKAHNGEVVVEETISRNLTLYPAPSATSVASAPDTGAASIKTAILANNIGYLRIDGFTGSQLPQLLEQAMDRLATTSGLLIDVRKNGGGDLSGNIILQRLISENKVRYFEKAINSEVFRALRSGVAILFDFKEGDLFSSLRPVVLKKSLKAQYTKPVVLLTSSFCFSACDTFASGFKQNKLGLVVGESTGGGTGSPQVFELPISDHQFRYSVMQGFTAVSQEMIEGQGTVVDQEIEVTVAERVEKKDRQLEKSLAVLASELVKTSNDVPPMLLNVEVTTDVSKPLEIEHDEQFKKMSEL